MDLERDNNLLMTIDQSGYDRMLEVMNALGNKNKMRVYESIDDWIHLTEIAENLGVTNAYVSSIIKQFDIAELIEVEYIAGLHGVKKLVRKKWLNITLGFS